MANGLEQLQALLTAVAEKQKKEEKGFLGKAKQVGKGLAGVLGNVLDRTTGNRFEYTGEPVTDLDRAKAEQSRAMAGYYGSKSEGGLDDKQARTMANSIAVRVLGGSQWIALDKDAQKRYFEVSNHLYKQLKEGDLGNIGMPQPTETEVVDTDATKSDQGIMKWVDKIRGKEKSPYAEYPDAFKEGGKWKVMKDGKKYRIEE